MKSESIYNPPEQGKQNPFTGATGKKGAKGREPGRSEVKDGDRGKIKTKSSVGGRGWRVRPLAKDG
jgi:hypothetical protein